MAAEKGRSMNSEIVAALEKHVEADDDVITYIERKFETLERRFDELKDEIREMKRNPSKYFD